MFHDDESMDKLIDDKNGLEELKSFRFPKFKDVKEGEELEFGKDVVKKARWLLEFYIYSNEIDLANNTIGRIGIAISFFFMGITYYLFSSTGHFPHLNIQYLTPNLLNILALIFSILNIPILLVASLSFHKTLMENVDNFLNSRERSKWLNAVVNNVEYEKRKPKKFFVAFVKIVSSVCYFIVIIYYFDSARYFL